MNLELETSEILEKCFQPTWESKIAFYREWVTEWDASAMVKLLERISQSHYSELFYPVATSHDWLCLSTEKTFNVVQMTDHVSINYDDRRQVFHLHYYESKQSKIEKGEYYDQDEMIRAVESALLRMKMQHDAKGAV